MLMPSRKLGVVGRARGAGSADTPSRVPTIQSSVGTTNGASAKTHSLHVIRGVCHTPLRAHQGMIHHVPTGLRPH